MHLDLTANALLTLLVAAVGFACSATALLVCEYVASRDAARRAPAILAAVLAGAAALLFLAGFPGWLANGLLGVSVLLAIAGLLKHEPIRVLSGRLLRPKAVWAALLCFSALAARFFAANVLNSLQNEPLAAAVDLSDVPVTSIEAVTDKGRGVSLFHFKINSVDDELQRFVEHNEKDHAQLIRLIEANPASNCHGWVFTGGRYGIRDPEVGNILSDHEYVEIAQPREGDLAIYRRGNDICHSGLVRIADRYSPILVESKWGPLGVYLHATNVQPFGGECHFYRSVRSSHTLAVRRADSDRATASITRPGWVP